MLLEVCPRGHPPCGAEGPRAPGRGGRGGTALLSEGRRWQPEAIKKAASRPISSPVFSFDVFKKYGKTGDSVATALSVHSCEVASSLVDPRAVHVRPCV